MSGKIGAFNRTDLPTYSLPISVLAPFTVVRSSTTQDGNNNKVTVTPGTILGIIPQISNVSLDNDPAPSLTFTANGLILIRVDIDGFSDTFRPSITTLTIKKQDGNIIKDDDGDELNEITMIWDDENTKSTGYFYLKIAAIRCSTVAGVSTITTITQYLNKNVYSFIITVDEIIILSS